MSPQLSKSVGVAALRIDARILIPVAVASLVVGAITFGIADQVEKAEQVAEAREEAQDVSDRAAALLDGRMTDHLERLRTVENIAETTQLQLSLVDPKDVKVALLQENLDLILQENTNVNGLFERISITDNNGQVIASYREGREEFPPFQVPPIDVLALLHHYATSPDDAPFIFGREQSDGDVRIHYTVPLRDERGRFIGLASGQELLSTLIRPILEILPDHSKTEFAIEAVPVERHEAGRIHAAAGGTPLRDVYGIDQRVYSHTSVPDPRAEGLHYPFLAGGLLMTLAIVLGVAAVSVRYNVKPLEEIAERLRRIGGGERALHLDNRGPHEIKALAHEVNAMVAQLEQREKEHDAEMLARSRLEKYATLGSLSAGVAHEVNNPLSVVRLANDQAQIQLRELRQIPDLPAEVRSHLDLLDYTTKANLDAIQRISKIVQSLGMLARPSKGETACDAAKVIDASLSLLRSRLKDRVHVVLDVPDQLRANVDADGLGQVVLNLLLNALDAVPETDARIEVHARRQGDRVQIDFEDNGPGIPLEARKNLFKPFFTTKPKGTGLGLSVSQHIAETHHGSLHFEDREGGGTRFRLDLPGA